MVGMSKRARRGPKGFADCSGCNLCLLVCPVWRRTHDFALTPHGRAKALQFGAAAGDIADSVLSCTMCAACEPVCPEEIPLVDMTLGLRRQLPLPVQLQNVLARMEEQAGHPMAAHPAEATVLLPDPALRERPGTLARALALLGGAARARLADDDGSDIALALEAGCVIPTRRMDRFLGSLRGLRRIVLADGLLSRHLRILLPGPDIIGLGEALSGVPAVRGALRASDLYVIEPRAYHADYQRLVGYYDALRTERSCAINLDLQRIAIPATARSLPQRLGLEAMDDAVQLGWILQGRKISRIVVESAEDGAAFERFSNKPVVHLADLADDKVSTR
jgi:ferredoxin